MFGVTEKKIEKWKIKNNAKKIAEAMNHKNKNIRLAAIKAGAELKDDSVFNTLVALLKDPDPEIRACSAESLGKLGRPSAQEHLKLVSETDSDKNVREKALEAMRIIIAHKTKIGS